MIKYDDFKKVELKTAKILEVKEHPSTDKLYVIEIDLGSEKRQIVAGIKNHYTPEELRGKNIAVVTNLEPATIRGVESKAMLLAASGDNRMAILTLDKDLPPGSPVQ